MRILPAQALYAYDRLSRAMGRRIRPSLPPRLIATLDRAQQGRGPVLRRAARLINRLLHDRPFPVANTATTLLLGLLFLHMNGIRLRLHAGAALSALRRWPSRPPDIRSLESWLRRRVIAGVSEPA